MVWKVCSDMMRARMESGSSRILSTFVNRNGWPVCGSSMRSERMPATVATGCGATGNAGRRLVLSTALPPPPPPSSTTTEPITVVAPPVGTAGAAGSGWLTNWPRAMACRCCSTAISCGVAVCTRPRWDNCAKSPAVICWTLPSAKSTSQWPVENRAVSEHGIGFEVVQRHAGAQIGKTLAGFGIVGDAVCVQFVCHLRQTTSAGDCRCHRQKAVRRFRFV